MKRNLGLLGILIALLTLTYFVYEVGEHKQKIQEVQEKQLFRPDELGAMLSMSNVVVTLEREGNKFYTQKNRVLVDERKLDAVFEILAGVRAMRILNTKEMTSKQTELMFPEDEKYKLHFEFERGNLTFIFGEKLKFDQTFYLKIIWKPHSGQRNVRTMIAEDVSPSKGMYNKENYHLSGHKYKRLLTILYLDAEFFYETRPFSARTEEQLLRLSFMPQSQRPFMLNFLKETTTPPPLKEEVALKRKKMQDIRLEWARLEADRVSPSPLSQKDQDPLTKILSAWSTQKGDEEQMELKLYRAPKASEFWLEIKGQNKTYIFEKRPDLFFATLQDFWDKSPLLPELSDLSVQGEVKHSKKEIADYFTQEAQAVDLLGAWPKDEGRKILTLTHSSDNEQMFDVYRVQNELHLRDTKRGLIYRYFQLPDWARIKEK